MIDIHSHMDICKDYESMIEKAHNIKILTCGIDINSNRKALEIAKNNKNVFACLGIYPIDALQLSDDEIAREIKFIRQNKENIVAIGEVGMDLKEDSLKTIKRQEEILKQFVHLAKDMNIPVIIHSRKAEFETIELLEKIGYNNILMHCFSGKIKLVERIVKNKWCLSIPTSVKNSAQFQEMIKITPIEQLFCETDSPFLHPDKKFPNEPANVIESYKKIAEIKGLSLKEVEKKIEENYKRLFE